MSTQAEIPAVEANASLVEPEDQQQLVAIVHQNNLNPDTALSLQSTFAPLFKQAREVMLDSKAIVVTDETQTMRMQMARVCRLKLKAIRVTGDKTRKETKEESLRRGKAIDGFFNILAHTIESEENRLEAQEQFVERQEAARKAALKEAREKVLLGIQVDPNLYQLGDMTEETFQQLVEGTKLARAAEAERRRKEEADRIEREAKEQAERERVRLENERLKREADEKEAASRLEREMAAKELKRLADEKREIEQRAQSQSDAEAKERARVADEHRIAAEKAKAEIAALEEAARKEKLRLQAIAEVERQKADTARKEAEQKAKAQREADELRQKHEAEAARKAAAAPDRDKLIAYAHAIAAIDLPEFTTENAKALATTIKASRDKFRSWILEKSEAL